jgi:uncharacterized damage-inducible protein DinB
MKWQELIADNFGRVDEALEKALEGLTLNDLNIQVRPDCNSIGWLTWHLTRAQDRAIASLTGEGQLWVKDKWHANFNRPPDTEDSGFGHGLEDLAEFKSPDVQTLRGYHQAVLERTKRYISNLTETDLGQEIDHPKFPTVGKRLAAVINDNLQHAGQVAYLRGLLTGKGWRVE